MSAFSVLLSLTTSLGSPSMDTPPPERTLPAPFSACSASDADPYEVSSDPVPKVDGHTLHVTVTHGGGCQEHEYQICWPTGTFDGSDPARASLEVWHNANHRWCEAKHREDLTFDLTPLREAWRKEHGAGPGTLQLAIGGQIVDYTFEE